MIVKPSELPTAKEVRNRPAVRKVSGWRLDNHQAGPTEEEALEFADKQKASFFKGIRMALQRIDDRRHTKATA